MTALSSYGLMVVVGRQTTRLIGIIDQHARDQHTTLHLVGGVVRDLLLNRRTRDVDFMLESPRLDGAIQFAFSLQARFGGQVQTHPPFGTAKWILDSQAAETLELSPDDLPEPIDFAVARGERYEYPTALPTTYPADLNTDLARRDFTINTLALRLIDDDVYELIDLHNGVQDLRAGLLRVLHDVSFIDDPTRMLRGARFEHRFGFTFEPHTLTLLTQALPMLTRITGERVRSELALLLLESQPESALLMQDARGVLAAIHPGLQFSQHAASVFARARLLHPSMFPTWVTSPPALSDLYWLVWMALLPPDAVSAIGERLLFAKIFIQSMTDAARLTHSVSAWKSAASPSRITYTLENLLSDPFRDAPLLAAWLSIEDGDARATLEQFASVWRHVKTSTTGETLTQMGLKPGKCYGVILSRLRAARIDGDVSADDERQLLNVLIEQGICRDHA
jgi:tRNA nucleotidyltransferase (CCA-adding enzyme)